MTHHTDAERAEFEAWLDKCWSRQGHIDDEGDFSYDDDWVQGAFVGWAEGRRAPAAPVPQGWKLVPVELLERIQESLGSFVSDQGWSQSDMDTADALDGLLAAAPQPPEAAPVQMPEPVAFALEWTFNGEERGMRLYDDETHCRFDAESDGGVCQPLYTEQQVRELLAAQASVSNGTLPSQPTFKTEDGVEAREPLTDEEILDISGPHSKDMRWPSTPIDIARAIERAHGIGVEKP